ncbi:MULTISPECIES: DUF6541 family protein [unclassified Mycolicibacterium]|nr:MULTISPECIES: DUF6541 family protein [unclassified Mycolicibacterium]MUM06538.1 hypothetical protein [Mycolicibacterium sp. CBMA 213]
MVAPGAITARVAQLTWPVAIAVGPAVTYGIVALATVPLGAVGVPWNGWTAIASFLIVVAVVAGLRRLLRRYVDTAAESLAVTRGAALIVAGGIVVGASAILISAILGMPHWQSIPSTWDSVWHANTIRWILDVGQASPMHMGELRNVETHALLYYPSTFHALAAVMCQLTGTAPTTAYTLSTLAASVWLFPVSAATLTWALVRPHASQRWTAGATAAAAALAASFTSVPYVEFDVAAVPNLVAYGLAGPTTVLIMSCLRHRDRIPLAIVALIGVFSTHITGGIVVVTFVGVWWLCDTLWHPVRSRLSDFLSLVAVAVPSLALLLPQFIGVLAQADIIVGHEFVTHQSRLRVLFNAIVQHTRHLNDYPIQNMLVLLSAVGGLILLVKRIWWPLAVWLLLMVAIVHSGAPFGGPLGFVIGRYSDLYYSDPRRLSAVVTMMATPFAGIALFGVIAFVVSWLRKRTPRTERFWAVTTAALLLVSTVGLAWHYFPRHRYLIGQKYDQVMVNDKNLEAYAYLATLPGAKDTLIGDANTDGTSWMYAAAGLHPLWTHYDYPQQQGPGYHRFIFWAYANKADTDRRIAEAVHALNIKYVITSSTIVRGFVMPDGLVSLDKSKSWAKIYDNGRSQIYEWRGDAAAPANR